MFEEFPKWKYSAAGAAIVNSAEEELALDEDKWFDTPAEVQGVQKAAPAPVVIATQPTPPAAPESETPPPPAAPDREALIAEAQRLGVKFDNRWGDAKLAAAIAAHQA